MIVVAKGLYGLGGSIAILVDALRLGDQLGCGVMADWAQGHYAVRGGNIADILFDYDRRVPWPGSFDGLRVFPEIWSTDVARTKPKEKPLLWKCTTADAEDYGLDRLAADYDVVVVSRDSRRWTASVNELAPYVKALRPNREIRDGVDALGLSNRDIGVHFRHGNGEPSVVPPDIGWFFEQVDDLMTRMRNSRVFVCTDCAAVLDAFVARYGQGRVLSSPKDYLPLGAGGMHTAGTDDGRYRSAIEAAVDMWALGGCGAFVGSSGYFSGVVRRLGAPWNSSRIRMWTPVHRSYSKPSGVRPVTLADPLGGTLSDLGVSLDGIHVSEVADDAGRWGLFYLYQPVASLASSTQVGDPSAIIRAVSEHRLY